MTLNCHFGLRTFYAFSMFSVGHIHTQHKALLVKHRSLFLVNWIIIFCFKSTAFWGISLYSPVEWGSRLNLAPYFFPVLLGFFWRRWTNKSFFSPPAALQVAGCMSVCRFTLLLKTFNFENLRSVFRLQYVAYYTLIIRSSSGVAPKPTTKSYTLLLILPLLWPSPDL